MEEEEFDSLRLLWDHYLKARASQKPIYLNKFLRLYYELSYKRRQSVSVLKDTRSSSSLLIREFIADINACCQCGKNDQDIEPLCCYLLQDRGWLILYTLNQLPVSEAPECFDLASILVSIFKMMADYQDSAEASEEVLLQPLDLESCFGGTRPPTELATNVRGKFRRTRKWRSTHVLGSGQRQQQRQQQQQQQQQHRTAEYTVKRRSGRRSDSDDSAEDATSAAQRRHRHHRHHHQQQQQQQLLLSCHH